MEEDDARYYIPVANISKRDFLGVYGIEAFIVGSITFAAAFAGVVAVLFNMVIVSIDQTVILLVGMLGILGYLFYIFLYITLVRRKAAKRYDRGKEALVKRIEAINELEEIYIEEEESRSPTISMETLNEALSVEALSAELPQKPDEKE